MMRALGDRADELLAGSGPAGHGDVQDVVSRALELGGATRYELLPETASRFRIALRDEHAPDLWVTRLDDADDDEQLDIEALLERYAVETLAGSRSISARALIDRMRSEDLLTIIADLLADTGRGSPRTPGSGPTERPQAGGWGWDDAAAGWSVRGGLTPRSAGADDAPPEQHQSAMPPASAGAEPPAPPAPAGEPPAPAEPDEPAPKQISAWVDGGAPPAVGVALDLLVRIGDPVAETVFTPDQPTGLAASDIPPEGLDTEWTVCTPDATFAPAGAVSALPQSAGLPGGAVRFALHVPASGDSDTMTLTLTPLRTPVRLEFRLSARGGLYRTLHTTLYGAGEQADPNSAALDRDLVLSRADRLGTSPAPEPEILSIAVNAASTDAQVTGSGPGWAFGPQRTIWNASIGLLDNQLKEVRRAADALRATHSDYLDAIDAEDLVAALSDFEPLTDWAAEPAAVDAASEARWTTVAESRELKRLAVTGSVLYDAVFPPGTELRELVDRLKPGAVLDIAWCDSGATVADVPWTLMYQGARDEPVDPRRFLGLRYRLKYFAYPPRGVRETFIGAPDQVGTACCLFWGGKEQALVTEAQAHHSWRTGVKRTFVPPQPAPDAKQAVLELLSGKAAEPLGVLYLFCHYGKLPQERVGFRFGDDNQDPNVISLLDLQEAGPRRIPLIVANACDTSAEDAYHVHPVKAQFFSSGAGAYVGTEAKVPVAMASRFGTALMALFDECPGGSAMPVGEAIAQARMLLWNRYRNLGGLFYSCVNDSNLQRRSG